MVTDFGSGAACNSANRTNDSALDGGTQFVRLVSKSGLYFCARVSYIHKLYTVITGCTRSRRPRHYVHMRFAMSAAVRNVHMHTHAVVYNARTCAPRFAMPTHVRVPRGRL